MDNFKCSSDALLKFYDEDKKVLDVIEDIEKELSAENKVVCQFTIDGRPLTIMGESDFADKTLSQVKTIEYSVTNLIHLVIDVAEGWVAAIDEQAEPIFDLATEMVEKPSRGAYKKLEHVFIWCSEFVESLTSMKIYRAPFTANAGTATNGTSQALAWDQLEAKLSGTVRELLAKSEKKDFKGVAYALEYDLVENLQAWRKELETFVADIRRSQKGSADTANRTEKTTSNFVGGKPARSGIVN